MNRFVPSLTLILFHPHSFPISSSKFHPTSHLISIHLHSIYPPNSSHNPKIHGPLHPLSSSLSPTLTFLIATYDGAAGMPAQEILDNPSPMPKWKEDYYREVILPDERRFLVSEALEHIYRVPPQSVKWERKVVIDEGKVLVEVPESVWEVWRGYESRGKEEEGKGKVG
jgi:hypothetical protein